MEIHRVEQSNERFTINSLHYIPDAKKDRNLGVVMGHGFSVSKHHLDHLASSLCYYGYEVVSLDFPAHKMGASRGPLAKPADLVEAMQLARKCTKRERVVLLGHSMGAATAIRGATFIDGVIGLVVLGMGQDPEARYHDKIVESAFKWGAMYVENVDPEEFLRQTKNELIPYMAEVTVPTLVIGGTEDFIIPVAEAKKLAEMPQGATTFKLLDCGHQDLPDAAKKAIRGWLDETF